MSSHEIDILDVSRGTITAPAGCGKTQLITGAINRHSHQKPVLVLTHTNAGVAALRTRLERLGVNTKKFRLPTIDGWSMRLASLFPVRSKCANTLELRNPGRDYPALREAAILLLEGGHISDLLAATYSRIIVDEYQDCSKTQHRIVVAAAETLPVCALGDPLQAIFGFKGNELPDWETHVCQHLPHYGELSTPWRWLNAGEKTFGEWLLSIRSDLLRGRPIDLRNAPTNVIWVPLDGTNDHKLRLSAVNDLRRNKEFQVLVIADSRNKQSQQRFASQIPGASTVEAVDLRDLIEFADRFDPAGKGAFRSLMGFADKVMTGINIDDIVARLKSIAAKNNRLAPSDAEMACFKMLQQKDYQSCAELLVELNKQAGVRVFRSAVFRAGLKALQMCSYDPNLSLSDAAIQMREQNRLIGRPLPKVAVGSTLLLKGLEADGSVILEADSMDANNLYVAMTRGATSLTICSRLPIVNSK